MQAAEEGRTVPEQRATFSEAVDRATIVAEARLLVQELDGYLALISEWATEDHDDD